MQRSADGSPARVPAMRFFDKTTGNPTRRLIRANELSALLSFEISMPHYFTVKL